MNSGNLKNILLENDINLILLKIALYRDPLYVFDCIFDQNSRSKIYLHVSETKKPRTNKINTIKSYLLDFKDTHTLYAINTDRNNTIYTITNEFYVDREKKSLILEATR